MSTSSSTSSTGFTGSSSYAADLQTAISRAIGFAALPLQLLQNQQNAFNSQQSEIQTLSSKFSSLQTALNNLNTAVSSGSYSASSSTATVATAYASSGVKAGSYNLIVGGIGSHTSTLSNDGLTTVTDPAAGNVSAATSYTLTVDGTSYQISNTGGTLSSLVDALNASSANVQATMVNVGSASSPDYRLSVQGTKYADNAIQLSDGTQSLLNTVVHGSNVTYQVNGRPAVINSDSRSINLSTGLTVNVLQAGSTDVTVSQSSTQTSNALAAFANSYNNIVDELAKSRGQSGGALSGQSIVYTLSSSLRSLLSGGASSGNIHSVSDLGLTFDQDGHLNFDATAFSGASSSSLANVLSFLGTSTSGGFLQAANNTLKSVADSSTGVLSQTSTSLTNSLTAIATKISDKTKAISDLQATLTAKMSAADALISSLEQQVSYYTTLFKTMGQIKEKA